MKSKQLNTKVLVMVAMMGALSTVLMALEFPIPFAPSFMKFDISELPALFTGFFLGPASGCAVVLIKILLKLLTRGTDTAFVGEAMNMIASLCFVLPSSLIYRWSRTKGAAIVGMTFSTIFVGIVCVFLNAFISFPLYARIYGMTLETIISMTSAVNPLVNNTVTLMLLCVFPFNLLKYGVTSVAVYFVYKKLGTIFRNLLQIGEAANI